MIEIDAVTIASIIMKTDTELRGALLKQVAKRLRVSTNFYTANLFDDIAKKYGISPKGKL